MNSQKHARTRQVVDFLRTSLRSLTASTPGKDINDGVAAAEVEQDIHNLLEAYALGRIGDTRSFLSSPDHQPVHEPDVAIR